jgi:hypothetical protein
MCEVGFSSVPLILEGERQFFTLKKLSHNRLHHKGRFVKRLIFSDVCIES